MVIHDLITGQPNPDLYFISLRGANGSGKSSIAHHLVKSDPDAVYIYVNGLKKIAFTYCPNYNILLLGGYKTQCGGCDTLVMKQIVPLLKLAWMTTANVIYEGAIVGDSKASYYDRLKELNNTLFHRKWGFAYLHMTAEECIARVYKRNGGKPIKEDMVRQKHRNSVRYRKWQEDQGDCAVITIDATGSIEEVFNALQCGIQLVIEGQRIIKV